MSNVIDAINESRQYDKIVTVDVDDMDAAMGDVVESVGDHEDYEFVDVDDNTREVWGYDEGSYDDSMTFRIILRKI